MDAKSPAAGVIAFPSRKISADESGLARLYIRATGRAWQRDVLGFAGGQTNRNPKLLAGLWGAEGQAGWGGRFEPPHGGIKIRCLTAWRRPNVLQGWLGPAESGRTMVRAFAHRNGWRGDFASGASWSGAASNFCERRRIGVGAADEDADTLVLFRPIGAAGDGGEGRRAAGLGDDRHVGPEFGAGPG